MKQQNVLSETQKEDGFKTVDKQGTGVSSQKTLKDPRLNVVSSSGIKKTGYMGDVGRF